MRVVADCNMLRHEFEELRRFEITGVQIIGNAKGPRPSGEDFMDAIAATRGGSADFG
jgi:hypothetical protein